MNFNESAFLFVANRLQFLFLSGALGVRSEELLQHFPKFSKAKQDAHGRARAPGHRSVYAPWPRACRPPPPPRPGGRRLYFPWSVFRARCGLASCDGGSAGLGHIPLERAL